MYMSASNAYDSFIFYISVDGSKSDVKPVPEELLEAAQEGQVRDSPT